MKCDDCELETEIISQLLVERNGDKIDTKTPMIWKCPDGHMTYRKYDDLKTD